MHRTLIFAAFLCLSLPALAQNLVFIEDHKQCPVEKIDRQNRGFDVDGLTFDGKNFTGIEYGCTMTESVSRSDLNSSYMLVRVGYCEEPDSVYPTVFALRWVKSEFDNVLGVLQVWEGAGGSPSTYYDCQTDLVAEQP